MSFNLTITHISRLSIDRKYYSLCLGVLQQVLGLPVPPLLPLHLRLEGVDLVPEGPDALLRLLEVGVVLGAQGLVVAAEAPGAHAQKVWDWMTFTSIEKE